MGEIENGEAAFPWCGDLNQTPFISLGITARDYFAAKAMASYLVPAGETNTWVQRHEFPYIAETAYAMADAMLQARSK